MAPNIKELITSCEVELEQEQKRRERALAEAKVILAKAREEGRAELSQDEAEDFKAATQRAEKAKSAIEGVKRKLENAQQIAAMEADADAEMAKRGAEMKQEQRQAYDRVARVGREERTYHRGNDPRGSGFVRDVARASLYRDVEAESRLVNHMREERVERAAYLERAVGTGAFAGLTVPQYLTEMYAPAVAALRPFANVCNHHDLPPNGMTINISRITTASAVALQATENTSVQNTDMDDTLLTENVQTAAGQQTLSRQAIDRGTGVEDVVMDDLFRRYATTLDNTLINQTTTGLDAIASTQTYTDSTPTAPEVYGQLVQAQSSVETTLLGFAQPNIAVMHPRRWYSMLSAVSNSWPMINATGQVPVQALGVNQNERYGPSIRGVMANGLAVVVDANVSTAFGTGTNQDRVYVTASDECHLWEDPNAPVFIRAEQPAVASLGVLFVLYGYFAYTFRRFSSSAVKVDGTGLGPPLFNGS